MHEIEARWRIFRLLAPYFGKVVSARFIQKTEERVSGITRIHNLIEGIYKPKEAQYALSIASMLKNPYEDRIDYNHDRSWYFSYSPKSGALDSAVNQSLFNCMKDREPVLVLKQQSDKTYPQGATYRLLGLGLIDDFDASNRLYKIKQVTIEQFLVRLDPKAILEDDLVETALQLEALEDWSPYVSEDRAIYKVSQQKREAAFRNIVLGNYDYTCAVSGIKLKYGQVSEAQAAHIISKEKLGTDDPRNGLSLSHNLHWAFDEGFFSLSDQYEIVVHPKTREADIKNFPILDFDHKSIHLPIDEYFNPHPDAIEWHRKEVFGQFAI